MLHFKDSCEVLRDSQLDNNFKPPSSLLVFGTKDFAARVKWRIAAVCCVVLSETPEAAGQKIQVIQTNGPRPRWLEAASFQPLLCRRRLGPGLHICWQMFYLRKPKTFVSVNKFLFKHSIA